MADIVKVELDISTLNPANEAELAEIIRTMGYYVENSEEGYIDVYPRANQDMLTKVYSVEQPIFDLMRKCGYEVKRVCFQGEFTSSYVVFIDAKDRGE